MTLLAIGIGARSGVAMEAVIAAVTDALAGLDDVPAGLFTLDRRAGEPGLVAAARTLRLPLAGFSPDQLAAFSSYAVTRSERALATAGVPSVAETAALAGAGAGSRLLVPRRTGTGVTVAIATGGPGPEPRRAP
jgi:cobalt-precorrin 5A hydrolase